MSFKLNYLRDRVTAIFKDEVKENEIKNAFIEIVDNVRIKKIDFLIFDFTEIISYSIPSDYMETLKMITLFSSTWNPKVKVFIIATNPNIRTVVSEIIKRKEEFNWDFYLFESTNDVNLLLENCEV